MKDFEDYLKHEKRITWLREEQWRLERDARRERECRKLEKLVDVVLVLAFIVIGIAVLTIHAESADEEVVSEPIVYEEPIGPEVPEDFENEKIEAALLSMAHVLENVKITHYCSELRPHICGTGDGITASGRRVTPYVSVAVDPSIIPLGSDVLVDYGDGEIHYYRADDTGGGVKGKHLDLAVGTHSEALRMGVKNATVYWVAEE